MIQITISDPMRLKGLLPWPSESLTGRTDNAKRVAIKAPSRGLYFFMDKYYNKAIDFAR
jgi:hypothetical protein